MCYRIIDATLINAVIYNFDILKNKTRLVTTPTQITAKNEKKNDGILL